MLVFGAKGVAAAVCLVWALRASLAFGLPLAPDACTTLEQERHVLETSGVLDDLHATPDQAKALAKDKLERVERYVEISSLVLFRCTPAVAPNDAPAAAALRAAGPKVALDKRKAPAK